MSDHSTGQFDVALQIAGTAPSDIKSLRAKPGLSRSETARQIYMRVKRAIDILVTLAVAPAVLIVVAIAALAVLCLMGRPIFFAQDRVGLNGRIFRK